MSMSALGRDPLLLALIPIPLPNLHRLETESLADAVLIVLVPHLLLFKFPFQFRKLLRCQPCPWLDEPLLSFIPFLLFFHYPFG